MINELATKNYMKTNIVGILLIIFSAHISFAQNITSTYLSEADKEIIQLSKDKWQWMADKNVDELSKLFHDKAEFVHMGGSWNTERELDIIKSGGIWYKKTDIHNVSVNIIDNTAILLNRIDLLAEVGGNEVTNPFIVTEVYIKQGNTWKLGSLSFTKVMTRNNN